MMLANNTPHLFLTNTLAYLSGVSSAKEKRSLMRLAPGQSDMDHPSVQVDHQRTAGITGADGLRPLRSG